MKAELDKFILSLTTESECLQRVAVFLPQFVVADGLKHGFVIFINKYHHALARLQARRTRPLKRNSGVTSVGDTP